LAHENEDLDGLAHIGRFAVGPGDGGSFGSLRVQAKYSGRDRGYRHAHGNYGNAERIQWTA
jgi:hypothetical protein